MNSVVSNPYSNEELPWIKGNLHSHTTNSDGMRSPQEVVDLYAARGYRFLAISDHDFLTDPATLRDHGMTLIPANEVSANGPHILHIAAKAVVDPNSNRRIVLDDIAKSGGLAIVAHPNWEDDFSHCPRESLESWTGFLGVEIYNGVIRRLTGSPLATDRWDRLLGLGHRVWGFAHDDSHGPGDDEIAWIMVQSEYRDVAAILDAVCAGRFYASTGVEIESIRVCGNTISVRTRNAERIVVHSDFGRREAAVDGNSIAWTPPLGGSITYVRFECWGPGDAMAWTQPFFCGDGGEKF